MDFGVMSCALERSDGDEDGGEARAPARARGRFFDPSGAAAHAACRAAAYRRADGVVYVLDQTLGDVDARAIERGLREIVDARRGETRGVVRVLFATRRRSGVDRIDAATTVDRRARKPRPTPRDDPFALLRDVKAACAAVLTTNPLDVAFVLVEPPRGASLARALDSLRHLTLVEVDARAGTGVVDAFHALFAVAAARVTRAVIARLSSSSSSPRVPHTVAALSAMFAVSTSTVALRAPARFTVKVRLERRRRVRARRARSRAVAATNASDHAAMTCPAVATKD